MNAYLNTSSCRAVQLQLMLLLLVRSDINTRIEWWPRPAHSNAPVNRPLYYRSCGAASEFAKRLGTFIRGDPSSPRYIVAFATQQPNKWICSSTWNCVVLEFHHVARPKPVSTSVKCQLDANFHLPCAIAIRIYDKQKLPAGWSNYTVVATQSNY